MVCAKLKRDHTLILLDYVLDTASFMQSHLLGAQGMRIFCTSAEALLMPFASLRSSCASVVSKAGLTLSRSDQE